MQMLEAWSNLGRDDRPLSGDLMDDQTETMESADGAVTPHAHSNRDVDFASALARVDFGESSRKRKNERTFEEQASTPPSVSRSVLCTDSSGVGGARGDGGDGVTMVDIVQGCAAASGGNGVVHGIDSARDAEVVAVTNGTGDVTVSEEMVSPSRVDDRDTHVADLVRMRGQWLTLLEEKPDDPLSFYWKEMVEWVDRRLPSAASSRGGPQVSPTNSVGPDDEISALNRMVKRMRHL